MTKSVVERHAKQQRPPAPAVRVLMAEDNLINQKLAALLFKKFDVELTLVSDGAEAVQEVIRRKYHLVLMDVQMPVMDGIQATAEIRKRLGDKAPPIVALTANSLPGDEQHFLNNGMDLYIAKPMDFHKLRDVLDRYVQLPSN